MWQLKKPTSKQEHEKQSGISEFNLDSKFQKDRVPNTVNKLTCSKCQSSNWPPVLLKSHNNFIKLQIVKKQLATL